MGIYMVVVAQAKPSFLGSRLREYRDACGYTQKEVAAQVGVVLMTYTRWERGETEPTYSQLLEIARMFGKKLKDFAPPEEEGDGKVKS